MSGLLGIVSFAAMLAFMDDFAPYVFALFFMLFFAIDCTMLHQLVQLKPSHSTILVSAVAQRLPGLHLLSSITYNLRSGVLDSSSWCVALLLLLFLQLSARGSMCVPAA